VKSRGALRGLRGWTAHVNGGLNVSSLDASQSLSGGGGERGGVGKGASGARAASQAGRRGGWSSGGVPTAVEDIGGTWVEPLNGCLFLCQSHQQFLEWPISRKAATFFFFCVAGDTGGCGWWRGALTNGVGDVKGAVMSRRPRSRLTVMTLVEPVAVFREEPGAVFWAEFIAAMWADPVSAFPKESMGNIAEVEDAAEGTCVAPLRGAGPDDADMGGTAEGEVSTGGVLFALLEPAESGGGDCMVRDDDASGGMIRRGDVADLAILNVRARSAAVFAARCVSDKEGGVGGEEDETEAFMSGVFSSMGAVRFSTVVEYGFESTFAGEVINADIGKYRGST
jgi:hypothetical protein